MSDAVEVMGAALGETFYDNGVVPRHLAIATALSALAPGSRWTAADGTEMVAVPVETYRDVLDLAAEGSQHKGSYLREKHGDEAVLAAGRAMLSAAGE